MARPIVLVVAPEHPAPLPLRRLVEEVGAAVLLAPTLAQARLYLGKIRPRAILTLAELPDGDAAALHGELRALPGYGHTPLIVLAAPHVPVPLQLADDPQVRWPVRADGPSVLRALLEVLTVLL